MCFSPVTVKWHQKQFLENLLIRCQILCRRIPDWEKLMQNFLFRFYFKSLCYSLYLWYPVVLGIIFLQLLLKFCGPNTILTAHSCPDAQINLTYLIKITYKNSVPTSQTIQCFSITKSEWLTIYSNTRNAHSGQNEEFSSCYTRWYIQ